MVMEGGNQMEIKEKDFSVVEPFANDLLNQHTASMLGTEKVTSPRKLAFALEEDGILYGGISGTLSGENFHVNVLALEEGMRGQDQGSRLLNALEEQALAGGARLLTVSTQDYQALGFYEKHGYQIFGQLADCPVAGTTKYYLYKRAQSDTEKN